jgi:uncharacterized phage-associated protein
MDPVIRIFEVLRFPDYLLREAVLANDISELHLRQLCYYAHRVFLYAAVHCISL